MQNKSKVHEQLQTKNISKLSHETADHSRSKQMYISTTYDAYIAILDYKFIKHLCPILQGTFFFFFWFFLVQNTFKKKKKKTLCHSLNLNYSNFLIPTAICKKKKKKRNFQRQDSMQGILILKCWSKKTWL